jgi:hypothetical protein
MIRTGQQPPVCEGHIIVPRSRLLLIYLAVAGCMVGPTRIGFMPRMVPVGQSRDPDPTRVPGEHGLEPAMHGPPEATTRAKDPLPVGKISGALSVSSVLVWMATGISPLVGMHGTFDETGLVREPAEGEKAVP